VERPFRLAWIIRTNGQAMTRYAQRYQYDTEGSLKSMRHESESWKSSTRYYGYQEPSMIETEKSTTESARRRSAAAGSPPTSTRGSLETTAT